MPIYEYLCQNCGHEFEKMQKMTDAPIKKCPKCEKSRVKKKISLSGFQLKGGGWFSDGYTKSKNKQTSETSTQKENAKGCSCEGCPAKKDNK